MLTSMKIIKFFLFILLLISNSSAFSQSNRFQMAVGGGVSFYPIRDFGENYFTQVAPEIVIYGYIPLFQRLWLRPGLRANYSWLQPEMPQAIRVEENDLKYDIEIGLVVDWIILPSISFGIGGIYRQISLKTQYPLVVPVDDVSGTDNIPMFQTQLGIGFPIASGIVVIEPYGRYVILENDKRFAWGYGLEVTMQIF
ncbi:hypothetical protein [Fluviispira multicolorata]|uniref:Outer membrane protein beta-barrel domain-containing protein n=1 Tax=Fluviispira multicolorata TaxID=2654512 RepID=A0A833N6D8_9BACT|nr:hypothetical protein [Fluviispira multicolorata]KAB8033295.1 hypothetical protein GCL57_00950 [Fluviispira multicolorata]